MKKRKKKKHSTEQQLRKNVGGFLPAKYKVPKFIKVLADWKTVNLTVMDTEKTGHVIAYVISPKKKIYRYALPHENPSLVIDSPLLPAEHHIRLTRIKNKKIIKEVRRALRRN